MCTQYILINNNTYIYILCAQHVYMLIMHACAETIHELIKMREKEKLMQLHRKEKGLPEKKEIDWATLEAHSVLDHDAVHAALPAVDA